MSSGDDAGGLLSAAGIDRARATAFEALLDRVARELAGRDPSDIAARAAVHFDFAASLFRVPLLGADWLMRYPSMEVESSVALEKDTRWARVLAAHYLRAADGSPLSGRWVSLSDLPGGLLYERTFQGYSGDVLATAFGSALDRLRDAASRCGAQSLSLGDLSFSFAVLPRVPVAVVCYEGDEALPATARFLFDAAAPHYLPTDALASVGARLTQTLLREGLTGGE